MLPNKLKLSIDQIVEILTQTRDGMQDTLGSLYGRWLDEREYEDFADYADIIEKSFNDLELKGYPADCKPKFLSATKRPFGFKVIMAGHRVQFGITTTSIYFKKCK